MIEVVILFSLATIWLIAGAVQDIRKQEVSNWTSLSLVLFALGFRFFYCLFSEAGAAGTGAGFGFFYQGLIWFAIFFVLGNLLYSFRLFAGGDAKLFIALGAIVPLSAGFISNVFYFLYFLTIFFFAGAVYGFAVSFFMVLKNFKGFKLQFKKRLRVMKNVIGVNVFFALFLMVLGLSEWLFLFLGLIILIMPFLYIYAKAVDEACAVRLVSVNKIKEGDWLYEDVYLGKGKARKNKRSKVVRAKWEGLSKKDIKLLQRRMKSKRIKIRYGIAFVPAMLFGWIAFMVFFLATTI